MFKRGTCRLQGILTRIFINYDAVNLNVFQTAVMATFQIHFQLRNSFWNSQSSLQFWRSFLTTSISFEILSIHLFSFSKFSSSTFSQMIDFFLSINILQKFSWCLPLSLKIQSCLLLENQLICSYNIVLYCIVLMEWSLLPNPLRPF